MTHEPKPVLRALMIRRAEKLRGACPRCRVERPLSPLTGNCWPCDNLVSEAHPRAATDRELVAHGEMCNDCAIRPDSPERQADPERYMHIALDKDSRRSPTSAADLILMQARTGSGIFWCHKPFLEPEQEWGYQPKSGELTPLRGEHWRPCGGWCKAFGKKWARR